MVSRLKILAYPAISLDGFIAKPNGDSDWVLPEDEAMFAEEVRQAGCVIVGLTTFEQYKGIIYPIPGATNFVCTSRVYESCDSSVKYVGDKSGSVHSIVSQIQALGFEKAVLSGGAETNARFAKAGMIHEMRISIYPFFLGQGIPIFGNHQVKLNLELKESRLIPDVIHNWYKVIPD